MIYEKIVRLCEEKGVTIFALEKELGLGDGTVRRWNTSSPTVAKLKLVADYLGKTLDYFVSEEAAIDGTLSVMHGEEAVCGCRFSSVGELIQLLKTFDAQRVHVSVVKAAAEMGQGVNYSANGGHPR